MFKVGINGFGRIGKTLFLQLLDNPLFEIRALNSVTLDVNKLEVYLKHDSVHHYNKDFIIHIIDDSNFEISKDNRTHHVHIFRDRNALNLTWSSYQVQALFDCTGSYLTTEKCLDHNVDVVLMSAPPKDKTKTFVYGVNHKDYNMENVVSAASCTTNCITPVLKWLNDNLHIVDGNFTTIHATTASQYTVDILNKNVRTERSILNNIIPHTTGASSAISAVIPELSGKINGTSIRVPVSNVSLIDLNVEVEDKRYDLKQLLNKLKNLDNDLKDVIQVTNDQLVSCDFLTTSQPSIIDSKASMDLGSGKYKLMVWYDNEWSYSAQMLRLMLFILKKRYNKNNTKKSLEDIDFNNHHVLLRVDMNVPILNNQITDDYRIVSSLPTIKKILNSNVSKLIIITHLGRPDPKKSFEENALTSSTIILKDKLELYLQEEVEFLPFGVHQKSINQIHFSNKRIHLLENIRFHEEETKYEKMNDEERQHNPIIQLFSGMGSIFINDAFGCSHRKHMSIEALKDKMEFGYGYLMFKEMNALDEILYNPQNKKIIAIIGGGKLDDKIPMLISLSKKVKTIYLCGGCIHSLKKNPDYLVLIRDICQSCDIKIMFDGRLENGQVVEWDNDLNPLFEYPENWSSLIKDIGPTSLYHLIEDINQHDLVFWNGTLGIVENLNTRHGSSLLTQFLINSHKEVIVGGGDTAGFVNSFQHNFKHVSTGGGASIDYISSSF